MPRFAPYEVIWVHGGQLGTIKVGMDTRQEAETVYALVLAHYASRVEVELWKGNQLIKAVRPKVGL